MGFFFLVQNKNFLEKNHNRLNFWRLPLYQITAMGLTVEHGAEVFLSILLHKENITMTTLDLSPLYRSSVGFDRFASLLDAALSNEQSGSHYPPYNIEVVDDNQYQISLAVAGFKENELQIQTEKGVLTIRGNKTSETESGRYLHRGIANRSFERKFTLADYVEVKDANLADGLLSIQLAKEIPEAMKPKTIAINGVVAEQLVDNQAA